jgi:ferrochelatase
MAAGCDYEKQLQESCRLVSEVFPGHAWRLVYQSRSGPPTQPWLAPDVCDYLRELHESGEVTDIVILPIGFTSDHLEVLFDLDTQARDVCNELGMNMIRAATVGIHPRFIQMIRELICERTGNAARACLGAFGPSHDVCPEDCCLSGRPANPRQTSGR